jgi:hypothetical protein
MRLLHAPDLGGSTDSILVYTMSFPRSGMLSVLTDLKGQWTGRLLQEAIAAAMTLHLQSQFYNTLAQLSSALRIWCPEVCYWSSLCPTVL